jgi:hypothetical protein
MPRSCLRRLALPLGLSLGAHVLLGVGGALLLGHSPTVEDPREDRAPFLLSFLSPKPPRPRPKPRPAPDDRDYLPIDVEPRILPSTAPSAPLAAKGADGPGTTPGAGEPGGEGMGRGLLTAPPSAQRVVYLVDRSISMGPSGALATARKEIAASLRRLPVSTLFQIIAYNRHAEPFVIDGQTGLSPANPASIEAAVRLLAAVQPEGSTDHAQAIRRALLLRPDVLFLVTDADDLTGTVTALARLNRSRAAFHVIELSRGKVGRPAGPLARLAESTGGSYRRVLPEH